MRFTGEFECTSKGFCPKCGNHDAARVSVTRRVCGYLGSPDARPFNAGKQEEVKRRVKHRVMGRLVKDQCAFPDSGAQRLSGYHYHCCSPAERSDAVKWPHSFVFAKQLTSEQGGKRRDPRERTFST